MTRGVAYDVRMPKIARKVVALAPMALLPLFATSCERYKKPTPTTYSTSFAEPGSTKDVDGKLAGPGADFSNMVLKGKDLSQIDLTGANFSGTNFDHSFLSGSILVGANFENAKFQASNAYRADFTDANLTNASFLGTNAEEAIFTGANLTNADFSFSYLLNATFDDGVLETLKLNGARMPDGTVHKK